MSELSKMNGIEVSVCVLIAAAMGLFVLIIAVAKIGVSESLIDEIALTSLVAGAISVIVALRM